MSILAHAYTSLGTKGETGWPNLYAIPLTQGMTYREFCDKVETMFEYEIEILDKRFTVYVVPPGVSVELTSLIFANVKVDPNVKVCKNFAEFETHMGW